MTKFNLFALLATAALVGCTPAEETDKRTTDDTNEDSGSGDTNTDTSDTSGGGGGGGADTGLAAVFFSGSIQAPSGTFASANFGQMFYGVAAGEVVCDFRGDLPLQNATPATPGCPDCTWAFDLGPIENSTTIEGDCSKVGLADGAIDTYFDYDWGYTTSYVYTSEDGSVTVPFTASVMLGFTDDAGVETWFPFATNFSYGGNDVTQIYGNSDDLQFFRTVYDSSGQPYYAYYYL